MRCGTPHTHLLFLCFTETLKWHVPQHLFTKLICSITKSLMWLMARNPNCKLPWCHFQTWNYVRCVSVTLWASAAPFRGHCGAIGKNKWTSNVMQGNWHVDVYHENILEPENLVSVNGQRWEVPQFQLRLIKEALVFKYI